MVIALAVFISTMHCSSGFCQERFLSGSAVTGFTFERKGSVLNQGQTSTFSILRLNHRSFIFHPSLFSYSIDPRFSSGFENLQGLQKGTGFSFDSDILRDAPWPLRFSYSRIRRSARTFSGKDGARKVDSNLGLGGSYRLPNGSVSFQYYKRNGLRDPRNALLREFESKDRRRSFTGNYLIKDWNIGGVFVDAKRQNLVLFGDGSDPIKGADNRQKSFRLDTTRSFGPDTRLSFAAIRELRSSLSESSRSGSRLSMIRGSLTSYLAKKLTASVTSNYRTNSIKRVYMSSPDADQENPLTNSSIASNDWGVSSSLRYKLKPYLNSSGSFRFSQTERADGQVILRTARSMSGSTGINFRKGGRHWTVLGGYKLNLRSIRNGSETRSINHSMNVGFGLGKASIISASANYSWSQSQTDRGLFLGTRQRSQLINFNVSKRAFGISLMVQGKLKKQRSDAWNRLSDTFSQNFLFKLRIPRLMLNYSWHMTSGDSWQYYWLYSPIAREQDSSELGAEESTVTDSGRLMLPSLAAAGVPLSAHGQRVPESAAELYRISAESSSPSGELSSIEMDREFVSRFTGRSGSGTSLSASFKVMSGMQVNGSWIRNESEGSRAQRFRASFGWRFRQMEIEASYYLDPPWALSQRRNQTAMIRITRYFRIF